MIRCETLCKFAKMEKLDVNLDFLKKLIFEANNDGDLFLIKTNKDCFKEILKHFDKETVKKIILHKNDIGQNFLFKRTNSFEFILDEIFKIFGADLDLFNDLINSKDENGKTWWMRLKNKPRIKPRIFEIYNDYDLSKSKFIDWLKNHSLSNISKEIIESGSSSETPQSCTNPENGQSFTQNSKTIQSLPIHESFEVGECSKNLQSIDLSINISNNLSNSSQMNCSSDLPDKSDSFESAN